MFEELVISSPRWIRLSLERAERKKNVMRKEELIEVTKGPQHRQEKEDFSLIGSNGFQDNEPSSRADHFLKN